MPRWTSFALMAATALLAAPVGTRYLSQNKPAENALVAKTETKATRATARIKSGKSAASEKGPSESEQLLALEQDAVEEAKIDIAGSVCGFMSQQIDAKSLGCTPGVLSGTEIMLAILPDPIHTQMALGFDRGVDGIESELVQLGWVYDRSWLPWENVRRPDADRWQDRQTDEHLQHARETMPGVLLFRGKKEGEPRQLAVLLVSDTPTGGVNAEQFSQAVRFWRQPCTLVHQACNDVPRTQLAILGPTFSGSVPSLHHLLHENLAPLCNSQRPLTVTISSGTVSGSNTLDVTPKFPCSSITVRQESFAVNADYLSKHLREYSNARIANLSEGETSFGTRNIDDKTTTNLTFPRGISRLRRAYEQNGIVGFTQPGNAPKTQLELSPAEDDRNDDTVTNFSGTQNTLSVEAQMTSLAKTLTNERFDAVLLSASDMMDEIFVARYLSQHAPDVTVVVSDADEFFLRDGEGNSLQNVYTLSVWPLIERNSEWTNPPFSNPRVYPSKNDQGIAAALHHLVCTAIPLQDVQRKCSGDSYREYRPPFFVNEATVSNSTTDGRLKPPLWLSVIGHGGFMPVSLLDLDKPGDPTLVAWSLPPLPHGNNNTVGQIEEGTGTAIKLIAALVVALLILHGWACIRSRIDRPFAWIYALAERRHDMLRLLVRGTLSLFGVAALALLYVPNQKQSGTGTAFRLESIAFHLFLAGGEVLGVLISCVSLWLALRLPTWRRPFGPQRKQPETVREYAVALVRSLRACPFATWTTTAYFAVLMIVLRSLDWNLWGIFSPSWAYPTEKIFFSYRASLPFTGASPLLPLLFITAACAVWVHGIFSELAFFGHRIPRLPDQFEDIRCPSNKRVASLNRLLADPFGRHRLHGLAGCLLLTAFMMCLSGRINGQPASRAYGFGLHSLSHGPFDLWISLAAWLFIAVILQELLTAYKAWSALRYQCLLPLKQSPLRWGFTWIKGFSWKRIWTRTGSLSSNQIFDYLLRMVETNERIPGDAKLERCYNRAMQAYASDPKDGAWLQTLTNEVTKLHRRMKATAETKLKTLREQWKTDAGPLTGTEETRGMHMLQKLDDLKDCPTGSADSRKELLRRMGNEEFVALLYVGYITVVLVQIRHRIVRAAVMYILLMWALTSYPWMYRHTILIELSTLLIVLSATTIYIYSQMHRDEILSRTTETESGKLDSGFFEKVIPVIGVPLLTLIASQFPEFSNLIFSWIQPGLSHMQ